MVLLMVMMMIRIKLYSNNNFNAKYLAIFDVHRAVHCNIISIVKPTRCTSVSNLFYFGMTLYMFWTVFPSSGVPDC